MSLPFTTCGSTSADFPPFLIGMAFAADFFVPAFAFAFFAMLSPVERRARTRDCTRGLAQQTSCGHRACRSVLHSPWSPGGLAIDNEKFGGTIGVRLRGADVLRDPLLNKGTGFSAAERQGLRIEGLLPFKSVSQEQQAARIYEQLQAQPDPLQKYLLLSALQNRNAHLFYRLLGDHLEELMPIVYTPPVGTATQRFSRVFQGGGGVWITPDMKGRITDVLRNVVGPRRIRLLVVTDNESILGLGDQGAGGMAISVGKLALYTAAAGIDPAEALPVSLDFGTDNEELLADDQYFGWPTRRLRGAEYIELVDEFVTAVRALMPDALVQWEDFRKDNALAILDRFVDRVPSFNDDIQGTGAVVVAGINSALRVLDERLAAQRIVIFGAGAAGLGVARQIKARLAEEGVPSADRDGAVAVLDRNGLIVDDGRIRDAEKRALAGRRP